MAFFEKTSILPKKMIAFILALIMLLPVGSAQTLAVGFDNDGSLVQSATIGDEAQDQATVGETYVDETEGQAADIDDDAQGQAHDQEADTDETGGQAADMIVENEGSAEPVEDADSVDDADSADGSIKNDDPETAVEADTYANSVSGLLWVDMYDDIDNGIYAGDSIRQEDELLLAGYPVSLFNADDRSAAIRETKTDDEGRYVFADLETGAYVVGVSAATIDGVEYLLPVYYLDGTEGDNRFAAEYDAETDTYLYAYTSSIDVGEDTDVRQINAGMRTLPEIAPIYELISDNEIVVESESEFRTALANTTYTTIYLGADITMTNPSNSIVAARTLIINGTDPRPGGIRHTYTDYSGSLLTQALGGACRDITFKDITINIRNYYGIYYVSSASSTTVTLDNVTGNARQIFHGGGANTNFVIKNSNINLSNTGLGNAQEFVQNAGTARIEGKVTVTRDSADYDEIFFLTGAGSTVEIAAGADVTLYNNVGSTNGNVFYTLGNFKVGAGASFTCYSTTGFADSIYGTVGSVTIGTGSDVRFISTQSHSGVATALRGTTFTAEAGSNFLLYNVDTSALYGAFHFTNVYLNNPESFVVLNPSARAIGTNICNLTATNVSSIRYHSSAQIASLFNTDTYAYNSKRNYISWWAQRAPFNVTANNWTASSPSITNSTYSGSNVPTASSTVMPSLASGNFSASSSVYGIEIRGTIYTVTYDGNGENSGTAPASDAGVPNDQMVVTGNTGNLALTNHTFTGWNTAADGNDTPYAVGDTFTFTEDTTLYAQWILDKYSVSGTLSGGSVGGLAVNYTIDDGNMRTVTADPDGSYIITDIPNNSDVVITPPAQAGYTVTPSDITLSGVSADSGGNDFLYTLNMYTLSGSISGLIDNGGVTVSYSVNGDDTQTVHTDSGGSYIITDIPHGSNVVVTPPGINGFTVNLANITVDGIAADSTGNDFVFTRIFYRVTEKYVDESGAAFQNETYAELMDPPYNYGGSLDNIAVSGETYVYQGYKVGSYSPGDTPDGTGAPAIDSLTEDKTVYLIYHKVTGTISVTFPTGWDFYVDQYTYPYVEAGTTGDSEVYYSFTNESDKPVYVDLTEVRQISSGGLNLVANASISPQGSNDYSLRLIPAYIADAANGFTGTLTGITTGNTTMRLGALDGRYMRQTAPTSTNGYVTIGGYYAGYLSAAEKKPQLTFSFTFSLIP